LINASGVIRKMKTKLSSTVEYTMVIGDNLIPINEHIGKEISISHTGGIFCVQCGRKTSKSFQQGHCYPCMRKIFECNNCILHPEKCLVETKTCPSDDWAHEQCAKDHVVYLANSSALKIGVTRTSQVPTRWMDQGAMQAMPIYKTSNRYQAGIIEVAFKRAVSDKTNWRTMLKQDSIPVDLTAKRQELLSVVGKEIDTILNSYHDEIIVLSSPEVLIKFPVSTYLDKITSLSLDKTDEVKGVLLGIKGQYLILNSGVINIRKFSGYDAKVSVYE